jgi:hypothetical protein
MSDDVQEMARRLRSKEQVPATGALRRCEQSQCMFQKGGCRTCEGCKAEPLMIREDCTRCFECENLPGALRWEDPQLQEMAQQMLAQQIIDTIKKKQQEKEMEVRR